MSKKYDNMMITDTWLSLCIYEWLLQRLPAFAITNICHIEFLKYLGKASNGIDIHTKKRISPIVSSILVINYS